MESLQFSSRSLLSCKTKQNKIETKQNEIEATMTKQNEKKIRPKQNVCACAVAKLLLKVNAQSYLVL